MLKIVLATNRRFQVLCVVFLSLYVSHIAAWCKSIGWNPSFNGPPKITQIKSTSVLISWEHVLQTRECADDFFVKYWKTRSPQDYKLTDLISTKLSSVILVDINPGAEYEYQVVAREVKSLGRIDYNRSPLTRFSCTNLSDGSNYVHDDSVPIAQGHRRGAAYNGRVIEPQTQQITSSPMEYDYINDDTNGEKEFYEQGSRTRQDVHEYEQENGYSMTTMIIYIVCGLIFVLLFIGVAYGCIKCGVPVFFEFSLGC